MEDPRPDKVAVVQEVQGRLDSAEAAILTEYRGLTVAELAQLRQALAVVGGDYKVYKNTLVRLAVTGSRHEGLSSLLTGPTAIAFVSGEISAVAKALRDFSRTYPALVLKGGQHGDGVLSAADLLSLADLPSRDVLLARVAGAIAAPMQQLAGLLQALPRNLAYGLQALIDQRGGPPAEAGAAEAAPADGAETGDAEAPAAEASAPEPVATEAAAETTEADTADVVATAAPAEEPAAETETAPEG